MGAADRLQSWAGKIRTNPWLAVGIAAGFLVVCAWIGWAIHVTSEHSLRQGLGVLVVWPAIVAVLALISVPVVWAFRVIRASAQSGEAEPETEPESTEAEATETG